MNAWRVPLFLFGLSTVLFNAPLASLIVMTALALRYAAWEILILGLLTDFLFQPALPVAVPFFTLASLMLLWGLEPMRREFLVDNRRLL